MSIESMSIVLHHADVKGTAKLVLLGIANHDGDGGSWPSIETLCKYASCSESRVHQVLRELSTAGILTITVQGGGMPGQRRDRKPNLYTLNMSCPANCDGTTNHRIIDGVQSATPRPDVTLNPAKPPMKRSRGATFGVHGVQPTAPEPSLEPSIQSSELCNLTTDSVVETLEEQKTALEEEKQTPLNSFLQARRFVEEVWRPLAYGKTAQEPGGVAQAVKVCIDNGLSMDFITEAVTYLVVSGKEVKSFRITEYRGSDADAVASSDLPAGYSRKGGKIYGPRGYVVSPADLPRSADDYKAQL
jgi:hypothetical protein